MSRDCETQTIVISGHRADEDVLACIVACLQGGGLVAFPTDTVYGLAAHALLPEAIEALYAAKGRPEHNPLPVLIPDASDLASIISEVPAIAQELAEQHWPGPLTMVLPRSDSIPDIVTAGLPSIGVRVPDHKLARQILAACPFPVAVTSANTSGQAVTTTVEEVLQQLAGRTELVVDAGPCPGGVPSTVIDLTQQPPQILRQGPLTIDI